MDEKLSSFLLCYVKSGLKEVRLHSYAHNEEVFQCVNGKFTTLEGLLDYNKEAAKTGLEPLVPIEGSSFKPVASFDVYIDDDPLATSYVVRQQGDNLEVIELF